LFQERWNSLGTSNDNSTFSRPKRHKGHNIPNYSMNSEFKGSKKCSMHIIISKKLFISITISYING